MDRQNRRSRLLAALPHSKEDWVALGYIAGWKAFGRLPEKVAYRLGDFMADRFSHHGHGPAQLRSNLARVLGSAPDAVPNALVAASMRSYMRYWVECFRLPYMSAAEVARRAAIGSEGLDYIREAKESGDGIVLVLPHSGNWDVAGVWLVQNHGSFTTVAERLKPERLYDAFVEFRESLGFKILPLTGDVPVFPELRKALSQGEVVCLLGDRDLKSHGVEVEFFGEPTTMPIGAAKLAQETGARLHPVCISFTDDSWHLKVFDRVPVESRNLQEIVQDIASAFEAGIAAHPADWHMLQPMWKRDVEKRLAEKAAQRAQSNASGKHS